MKEVLESIRVLGLGRFLWLRFCYRHVMKLAHKFHWHYAPRIGPFEDGSTQLWCHWCGFRMHEPKRVLINGE